jgi:CRISPR system Cascade subunit CasB
MNEAAADRVGTTALTWWRSLQPSADGRGGDRGALARLRRAATALDAAAEPETLNLCRNLGLGAVGLERAAVTAAVLANVREHVPGSPAARQLGPLEAEKPTSAVMSWLRFRRLIQADTPDDQMIAFRRAVALAGRRINVQDLARSLIGWDDARRRRWLYAYHNAPASTGETEDTAA